MSAAGGGARDPRPVLFVTNHAPPFRVGAFRALHEREDAVFALIGGAVRHGGGGERRPRGRVPLRVFALGAKPAASGCRSPCCGRASAAWRGWPPPAASAP